ncbi:unnamed protein product [Bursaphelenchus xylophilus]|uniref:One cut domain family member n=1 Tax=Bursaphelenchus xylophilus TaxID=6326 RepID=A0A1I7S4D2_BURXY|nr:unnamed protein product [Bursaphelenchus xylophilus]CAG9116974.1 unnamed protein product [Bursaphelenchus xylophilus]
METLENGADPMLSAALGANSGNVHLCREYDEQLSIYDGYVQLTPLHPLPSQNNGKYASTVSPTAPDASRSLQTATPMPYESHEEHFLDPQHRTHHQQNVIEHSQRYNNLPYTIKYEYDTGKPIGMDDLTNLQQTHCGREVNQYSYDFNTSVPNDIHQNMSYQDNFYPTEQSRQNIAIKSEPMYDPMYSSYSQSESMIENKTVHIPENTTSTSSSSVPLDAGEQRLQVSEAENNGVDGEELNTRELAQRISSELKRYSIPQAVFAQRVLCRSQGTLSDLLRNPKPWAKLKSGRETFRRMAKWLQEPELQRMSALRLAVVSACKRKDEHHQQQHHQHQPPQKKPRLVFTDVQRRTLQAIFKETKRPSREMQITISQHLGLDLTTVANFFMNARRRGHDRYDEADDSDDGFFDYKDAGDYNYSQCEGASFEGPHDPANVYESSTTSSQSEVVNKELYTSFNPEDPTNRPEYPNSESSTTPSSLSTVSHSISPPCDTSTYFASQNYSSCPDYPENRLQMTNS